MPIEAWAFALGSASLFGLGLVITQFGLRDMTPALGATFSMPMAALVFWSSAPFLADFSGWDGDAVLLFAVVGIFFPGMITLLTFEANRLMGPYVSGAIGNLAPLFAVVAALVVLGEALDILQWLAVAAILGGVTTMSLRRQWDGGSWRRWVIALPLGAALCRGLGPPVLKIGLGWWPNPFVAVLICYAMSASVAIAVGLWRTRGTRRIVTRKGVLAFAGVGLCNGCAVMFWVQSLALGPVSLTSPVVACYPVFTMIFGAILLGRKKIDRSQGLGVLLTVVGVVLLTAS
jgi:drug/metabolite transporter (DMT)-like permease